MIPSLFVLLPSRLCRVCGSVPSVTDLTKVCVLHYSNNTIKTANEVRGKAEMKQ
jgi:hypothetical protein